MPPSTCSSRCSSCPRTRPGLTIGRQPQVFGYTDEWAGGHPEIHYDNVEVPADNLLGEEGGGFAIAQARLGPGRIHHCMRTIGVAERALGADDRPRRRPSRVREPGRRQGADPGLDRRVTHRDRHGPRVRAAHRPRDGHGGQQGGGEPDRRHQGRRPEHRPAGASTGRSRCTAPRA